MILISERERADFKRKIAKLSILLAHRPPKPPYLVQHPKVVQIDVGRQLFVDDYLIESSTAERTYHRAISRTIVMRPTKHEVIEQNAKFSNSALGVRSIE